MDNLEKQGGVAFLLIYFTTRNLIYYMRFEEMKRFWDRAANGGRKSFRFDELDPDFFLELKQGFFIPYLDKMNLDLQLREDE